MATTATVHKDRKKDCPAWKATCSCGVPHHYQKLCIKKGLPPPPKDKETKKEEELNSVVTPGISAGAREQKIFQKVRKIGTER